MLNQGDTELEGVMGSSQTGCEQTKAQNSLGAFETSDGKLRFFEKRKKLEKAGIAVAGLVTQA